MHLTQGNSRRLALLRLSRRFASEVSMFFFRAKLRIRQPEVENSITLKRLKAETKIQTLDGEHINHS